MSGDGLWRFPVDYERLPQEQPFLSDTTGDSLANDIVLADEPQGLLLTVTMQQYTDLLSAAINGANRNFGERYIDVIYPLIKAGKVFAGAGMSCEDVADCIDSDESVQLALLQNALEQGFAPSGNGASSSNVTMSPAQSAENLLPDDYPCSDAQLMATARRIVQELNEATLDFAQSIEVVTNTVELGNLLTDGVPIAGTVNNLSEFLDWMIETIVEQYVASYNQSVEDTLACAIFCLMKPDCELTFDDLISVMESYADPSEPFPSTDDFQAIVDWFMSLDTVVGLAIVASWFYVMLQAMRFGSGTIFELAGLTSLKSLILLTIGWVDNSYQQCDDCPPTETPDLYWKLELDFQTGKQGTVNVAGTTSVFENGGWNGRGNPCRAGFGINLGSTTYYMAKTRMTALRRGSDGNGTNDFVRMDRHLLENFADTALQMVFANFITCNENDCVHTSGTLADDFSPAKSIRWFSSVNGSYNEPLEMTRVTKVELWGYNHDDQKPPNSIWVDSLP